MTFRVITIFPKIFRSYFEYGVLRRALKQKLAKIKVYDLRKYTTDKRRTVDDTTYGGGAGMVLKIEPIYKCLETIKSQIKKGAKSRNLKKTRIILFSAKGKPYTQVEARRLMKYENIILICGRYEGVDERVARYLADEEISVGEYILTGGEIPAMVITDSVVRLIPGVLAKEDATIHESFTGNDIEYPQFTEPRQYDGISVPEVLLSGNHAAIKAWQQKEAVTRTKNRSME